jgi:hypothetical protein
VIELDDGYWEIPDGLDTSTFDFNWRPDPYDPPLIHQFGTQWQSTGGPRYIVPDYEGTKYYDTQHAIRLPDAEDRGWRPLVPNCTIDMSWHPDENTPPFIYVFGNQWYDVDVMPSYQYRVKGATEKCYITDIKATLLPNKTQWIEPDFEEYDFDYSWVPHPHEPPLIWSFGTQHQVNGGPKYITPGATETKISTDIKCTVIKGNIRQWRSIVPTDNYDNTWHPDENDPAYTYVFGNEFHTPEFMPTVMYRVKGAYETKYVYDMKAKLKIDKVPFEDTIYDAVLAHNFESKYVHFQNTNHPIDYKMAIPKYDPECLYAHLYEDSAIIPDTIKRHLTNKLTDYPYIVTDKLMTYQKPLDIIFISNGESCAEDNYEYLVSLNLPNRIVRVSNVDGRVNSQYAAANSSETPWYFLINAKLKINKDFDFNWQPNIMQTRKHYIFRARNPINNLEYGHMAMVANNKKLTLATVGKGLDFTMESLHEVVDILSGTAVFNSSWDVWRTAFRECIKLCNAEDEESNKRLVTWANTGEGHYALDSVNGARDAIEYYTSVNGDINQLMNSYDWAWLKDYYSAKYKL